MKKIGITTLHGYFNYGNKLQNYALQKTLEKKGFDVETIDIVLDKKYKFNSLQVDKDLFYLRTNAQTIAILTVLFRNKSLSRKDRLSIIKDRLDDERTIESFKNYNNFTLQERLVRRFVIKKRVKSLYYIFKFKNMIKSK